VCPPYSAYILVYRYIGIYRVARVIRVIQPECLMIIEINRVIRAIRAIRVIRPEWSAALHDCSGPHFQRAVNYRDFILVQPLLIVVTYLVSLQLHKSL